MKTLLSKFTGPVLDLLFPMECFGCRKEGQAICSSCLKELTLLRAPFCKSCGQPGSNSPCASCREMPLAIDAIRAPFILDGPVRHAVHGLKYRNLRAAAPQLGQIMGEYLKTHRIPGELLVPVPLHSSRLRQRGYNQSDLLAKAAAQASEISWENRLLTRTNNTPAQVGSQGRDQRRANVDGSFKCRPGLSAVSVILIDDVATTGSTLSACAAALKSAGAKSVWGLVLARES